MVLSAEQVSKIRGDLGITQQNMCIFGEMLTELIPGQEHPEDRSLFEQLHATCRAMQTRLVELIDQVDDDKLTADLLEVNDNMNNLFLRYDRYEKNKSQACHPNPPSSSHTGTGAIKKTIAATRPPHTSQLIDTPPLIDFSSTDNEPPSLVCQDMPSLARHKEEDVNNVSEWIGDKDEGVTSSEFDKFLAERAAAADSTPRKDSTTRKGE
jgi:hypothetical protein